MLNAPEQTYFYSDINNKNVNNVLYPYAVHYTKWELCSVFAWLKINSSRHIRVYVNKSISGNISQTDV